MNPRYHRIRCRRSHTQPESPHTDDRAWTLLALERWRQAPCIDSCFSGVACWNDAWRASEIFHLKRHWHRVPLRLRKASGWCLFCTSVLLQFGCLRRSLRRSLRHQITRIDALSEKRPLLLDFFEALQLRQVCGSHGPRPRSGWTPFLTSFQLDCISSPGTSRPSLAAQ